KVFALLRKPSDSLLQINSAPIYVVHPDEEEYDLPNHVGEGKGDFWQVGRSDGMTLSMNAPLSSSTLEDLRVFMENRGLKFLPDQSRE
ncbi:MAG: hypothetical protein ACOCVT_02495, partial [bacterium]